MHEQIKILNHPGHAFLKNITSICIAPSCGQSIVATIMGEARPSAAHDPVGAEIEDVEDQVDRYGTLLHGAKLRCS